ncbi:MAG: nitroreductase family protein [Lentisphaerales bacterium]|nr:nitroreductase family protein [Lentisphaerales bacterium]
MDFLGLMKKRRSIRKFKQEAIPKEGLLNLIEPACFAHSLCNRQSLRFWIVMDPQRADFIYQHSSLGSVSDGEGGLTTEKFAPPSYIAISTLGEPGNADFADAGAAFQNMAIMSMEMNLGLFWIHAFSEKIIKSFLNLPEEQTIMAIIAVGRPAENPVAINIDPTEVNQFFDSKEKFQKVPKLKTKYLINWR